MGHEKPSCRQMQQSSHCSSRSIVISILHTPCQQSFILTHKLTTVHLGFRGARLIGGLKCAFDFLKNDDVYLFDDNDVP